MLVSTVSTKLNESLGIMQFIYYIQNLLYLNLTSSVFLKI